MYQVRYLMYWVRYHRTSQPDVNDPTVFCAGTNCTHACTVPVQYRVEVIVLVLMLQVRTGTLLYNTSTGYWYLVHLLSVPVVDGAAEKYQVLYQYQVPPCWYQEWYLCCLTSNSPPSSSHSYLVPQVTFGRTVPVLQ
jgi:hypothetical protein